MQLAAPRQVDPLEKLELPSDSPTQIAYNEFIPTRLDGSEDEARERVEDAIQFAKWMRPNQPNVEVFVSPEPFVRLVNDEGGMSFQITVSHGNFSFAVNRSVHITIQEASERVAVGRKLLPAWDTLIKHLPEGFVIYGPDVNPESEDFGARERLLTGLGFSATNEKGDRFGIVRSGKLVPLSGDEFAAMAGEEGVNILYNQRFMVEEIIWPHTEE